MKWIDFMKFYDNEITDEVADFIMWNETAYPFSGLRMTIYQIRSAIRAMNNKINRCDLCSMKIPFHRIGCLNFRKENKQ